MQPAALPSGQPSLVTVHGAFLTNCMWQRDGALVVELAGSYGNNEVQQFHRLALSFSVFYSRIEVKGLTDHKQLEFNLSIGEMQRVYDFAAEYFTNVTQSGA